MSARFAPLAPDDPCEVGGYVLRARLGEGGMGRVYLAFSRDGRALAIKVVRPEYAQDPLFRRRFRREIAAAQCVAGAYTAPVVDADSEAPVPWLATLYQPGPTLRHAVREHGPLPPRSVFRLLAGVAEGLRAIHSCGVIHRDLKPANVILAADGPRVIDFGVAYTPDASTVTRTDMVAGTPAFMAPEQARGEAATEATDVFALGGLAVFAATGRPAFGEGTPQAVLYRLVNRPANLDHCPPELRAIAERALAKDPRARPSLTEIIHYARSQLGGDPIGTTEPWLPPEITETLPDYQATLYDPWRRPPEKIDADGAAAAKRVAQAIASVMACVGLIAWLALPGPRNALNDLTHYFDSASSPTPSLYTTPTAAHTSPAPVYTAPLPVHTPPDPVDTAPMPVYTPPDPVSTPPTPVYTPPVMYYGAIAVSNNGSIGKSWNYGSAAAAGQHALDNCRRADCEVLVRFVNSCGAIAYNPDIRQYWGGRGATPAIAEENAMSNAGGGRWLTWVCTTR